MTFLDYVKACALGAIVFAIGICYMMYLNHGCKLGGIMTWQGKVCVEDITAN